MEIPLRRQPNFTSAEIELLSPLVRKYADVLENKKSNVVNNKLKEDTWTKLAEDFNAISAIHERSSRALRAKYENFKKSLKRKYADHRRNLYGTGGGPSQEMSLTNEEKTIMELSSTSIEGLPARLDRDRVHQNASNSFSKTESYELISMAEVEDQAESPEIILEKECTPGISAQQPVETRFVLNQRKSTPLRTRTHNTATFNNTMGSYGELSLKNKKLVDAQLKDIEEKREMERTEHNLRCQLLESQIVGEHLKNENLKLDILLKKKQLNE